MKSSVGTGSAGQQERQGFSGTITNTSLPDIIQLLCIGRSSCRVHVRSGSNKGSICFRQGEIVHAETEGVEGEEAFYSILSWDLGSFDSDEEPAKAETIQENWDFLLMESMRRMEKSGQYSLALRMDNPFDSKIPSV